VRLTLGTFQLPDLNKFLEDTKSAFGSASIEAEKFLKGWETAQGGTEAGINKDYAQQLQNWKDLLSQQAITQQEFDSISGNLEKDRLAGLKRPRQDNGASTWGDAWQDMFTQLASSGRDFARSITQDIGSAIESLNQQLAKMVATGQGG
jgi:hypothetical protein